jgi:hypothetical protein
MRRILSIIESPLHSRSMSLSNLCSNPLDDSSSDDGSEDGSVGDREMSEPAQPKLKAARAANATVTAERVREYIKKTLEYYELDENERQENKDLYSAGAQAMQDICKELYDALINDPSWSSRARALFVAIQYSASVSYSELENDDHKKREAPDALIAVDLHRTTSANKLAKKSCQAVHIVRNHLFDWENERELYTFAQNSSDDDFGTVADPGTEDEFCKRMHDAAYLADGSVAPVNVRRLEGGKCVVATVRASESFVIEKTTQLTWVQTLYELFSWFIRVQGTPLTDWKKTTNREDFLTAETKRFMRKYMLSQKLATLDIPKLPVATPSNERKPKKMSAFDNYWSQVKHVIPAKTKKDLFEDWKRMSIAEKEPYKNKPASKPVATDTPTDDDDDDDDDDADDDDADTDTPEPVKKKQRKQTPPPPDLPEVAKADKADKSDKADKRNKSGKSVKLARPGKVDTADTREGGPAGTREGGLLHDVFMFNMNSAIARGAFARTTPFDDIISEALKFPEAERIKRAHHDIVKKISTAPGEAADAWKDSFRIFNSMFGPAKAPEPEPEEDDFIV